MQFVSAILGMLCWVSIFVTCCRYKKTIIATILASQQLDEWRIIKTVPIKAEAGPTLRPDVQLILTLFPPHETNREDAPMSPQHIMLLAFILIVIIASLLALAFAIWKKMQIHFINITYLLPGLSAIFLSKRNLQSGHFCGSYKCS